MMRSLYAFVNLETFSESDNSNDKPIAKSCYKEVPDTQAIAVKTLDAGAFASTLT
jgi:hypothetical protein